MYAAQNSGNVDVPRLRQVLAGLPQPEAADGRLVLAVDVTHWLRPDAPTRPMFPGAVLALPDLDPAGGVAEAATRAS